MTAASNDEHDSTILLIQGIPLYAVTKRWEAMARTASHSTSGLTCAGSPPVQAT
ncbi:MAG: hypothetical protein Q9P14_09270 [candidate division KSB1 bacterium]|nr:hypothetical protein [candidate division KSB1 bacterium]MDQ7064145.1 hypothetical protein [candidate division KSB1 bacterium]